MLLLVNFPVVPYFSERLTVNLLKLTSEERLTIGRTVVELYHLVVAVGLCKIVHKSGSVEICVGAHLEVHGRTFGLKTYYREQLFAAVDDATEVHLVVAAKCTTHTTAKPCLHETCDTLMIPAWCIPAWHTKIAPKG